MIQVPTKQAIADLDELLDEAAHGQDVVIIGTNGSAFKLVGASAACPKTDLW